MRILNKEETKIAREAYIEGARDWAMVNTPAWSIENHAKRAFPLPKIERPRVIKREYGSPAYPISFSLVNGRILYGLGTHPPTHDLIARTTDGSSLDVHRDEILRLAFDAYADLKPNPTELVEDTEGC